MNRTSLSNPWQSQGDLPWNNIADSGSLKIDPFQFIVNIDRVAAKMLCCDEQQIIGYNVWDILCVSFPAYHHQAINAAITNRKRNVIQTRLEGSSTPVFITIEPKRNGFTNLRITEVP